MTITDIRPPNSPEFEIDNRPKLGEIAPGEPIYMIPVNPWTPWTARTGGFAMGAWLAATETLIFGGDQVKWAAASAIAATLLFAWTSAGHELRERRPLRFEQAS